MNNPARYTDPSGHRACEDSDGLGGCLSEKEADQQRKHYLDTRRSGKTGERSDPFPGTNEEWEELADMYLPAFASGTKHELYFTAAFMGGGVWGLTLITTRDGDLQLYDEHGFAGVIGPNLTLSYTRGLVLGLETAADYEGGATSGTFGGTVIVGAWKADHGGKTGGVDAGPSLGISIPPLGMAHTTAEPIEGWGAQLEGAQVFTCRLLGMCGR